MPRTFCDGLARRDFLRMGAASVFGLPVALPRILAAKAPRDISFLYIFLQGGLSTIDTFEIGRAHV